MTRHSFPSTFLARRSLPIAFFLLLGIVQPTWSATAETGREQVETAVPAEHPGLDQLVPKAAELAVDATSIEERLQAAEDVGGFAARLAELQGAYHEIAAPMEAKPVDDMSLSQLLKIRREIEALHDAQDRELDRLSNPLKTLEELRSQWSGRQAFWDSWQQSLPQEQDQSARLTFDQALQTINPILERITTASGKLLGLQQDIFSQQEQIIAWEAQLDAALGKVRHETFRRNAHALFNPEFYDQFSADMWNELRLNLDNLATLPAEYLQTYGWIPLLQLVIALVIGGLLHYRTRSREQLNEEWAFLFRHPWVGGLFIALVVGGLFQTSPIPLWRWLQIVLGTLCATVLITAMLDRPRLRRVIMVLAALFIVSETLRTIGLPQPLYRLYLVVVCLTATPLCLAAAKRQVQRKEGHVDLIAAAFYFGTLVGIAGFITQVFGFATLTANLIDATLGTVFVWLFAHMALHLGEGGVSSFLQASWVSDRLLVQQLGRQTGMRIKTLLRLVIYTYTLLSLLVIWKILPSIDRAWNSIMGFSFSYGDFHLSVETVFLVICILYLTIICSWVLQATLDTQVLSPRGMDVGVRDSIKRLMHYALILIGLVTALGIAGIEMEKFAILAGALGVGIGFGLQNIVNNFVSGLILLFERPVKVGDTINIDDQWGTITKIGLRSTIFETLDRSEIIVPNSDLISQKVTNWTLTSNISRIVLPVGVAYGSSLDKVLDILLGVAKDHPDVLGYPQASAIFTGFGDSSIDFELRVWINDIKQRLRIRSELGLAIDRGFREAGITIPFPQRDLHLHGIESNLHGLSSTPKEPCVSAPTDKDQT